MIYDPNQDTVLVPRWIAIAWLGAYEAFEPAYLAPSPEWRLVKQALVDTPVRKTW